MGMREYVVKSWQGGMAGFHQANGVAFFLAIILMCANLGAASSAGEIDQEIQVKTGFVYKFLQYVTWPHGDKAIDDGDVFLISVVGGSSYLQTFKELTKLKTTSGKRIEIRKGSVDEDLSESQIVFIATDDESTVKKLLTNLEGSPTLTISDGDNLAELGMMINFVNIETSKGWKLRFEINNQAAKDAGLKIGAQLLKLAIQVVDSGDDE